MDTSNHDLNTLFLQLGLPGAAADIDDFIQRHSPLRSDVALEQAVFWNPAQAAFLRQAIMEDSDWCEPVDDLNARLRD